MSVKGKKEKEIMPAYFKLESSTDISSAEDLPRTMFKGINSELVKANAKISLM